MQKNSANVDNLYWESFITRELDRYAFRYREFLDMNQTSKTFGEKQYTYMMQKNSVVWQWHRIGRY